MVIDFEKLRTRLVYCIEDELHKDLHVLPELENRTIPELLADAIIRLLKKDFYDKNGS